MPLFHHLPTTTTHLPTAVRHIVHSLTTIPSLSPHHILPLLPRLRRLLPYLPPSFLSSLLSSSPSSLLPLLLPSLLPLLPSSLPFHSPILKLNLLSSSPSLLLHLHLPSAIQLFDEIPKKTTYAFTALINAHNRHHLPHLALSTFNFMLYSNVPPNRVTMVCALSACAARASLDTGTWIHRYVASNKWKLDVVLGTALLNMYGKCGRMDEGLKVFLDMEERNVYTWNALIGGFARANSGEEAVRWFSMMDVEPDEVTLIEVLSGCSRSGLVEVGRKVFDEMSRGKYVFLRPGIKHYGCMVDMLGRAGLVEEAFEMVERMEKEVGAGSPGVVVWGALLAGCRAHGRLELAEVAARKMVEKELATENVGYYVVLSNLYGEMGRWREAEEVWRVVKEKGMRKDAGWSCAVN